MREVVLDTETTGLEPSEGHRIVEIGAVEIINHMPTGRTYHEYINPQRQMPKEAFDVHGLGDDFLKTKPVFAMVADSFLAFIADAPLVIHNAQFDMKFLNAELALLGKSPLSMQRTIDTVQLARRKFPGSPATLDALCRRFGVDNTAREKHGALLDSELLAEVYLELIGGRQPDFGLHGPHSQDGPAAETGDTTGRNQPRPKPLAPRITPDEDSAHAAFIAGMGATAIWNRRK